MSSWSSGTIGGSVRAIASAACAAVLLAGCFGGGGDGGDTTPAVGTTLSGVAAARGALKSALVTAFPVNAAGVVSSAEITHKSTDANGAYALDIGSYAGAVQLVATAPAGTTTADETNGQDIALPPTFTLHANTVVAAPTTSQTQSASITAYTELAHNIAKDSGGVSAANIGSANGVAFALIGLDPVATVPLAANATPPAGATDAQKRYALFNAAVSRLARTPPQTADAATLTCYAGAGSDLGKKLQCATQQIATSVSVSGSGTQQVTAVNNKLVGLSSALVAASADSSLNKTGVSITVQDSAFKTLDALETAAAAGVNTPINGGVSTQTRSDVTVAKQFFSTLRSNAAALDSGTVDTGIVDGVKAFGDSLTNEVAALTSNTMRMASLPRMARDLWTDYKSGTTSTPSRLLDPSYAGGCTVFQGAFPTQIGGAIGQPYVSTSVAATSPAVASWIGCAANSGPLPADGTRRFRQTLIINMSADPTLAALPYLAVTRAEYLQAGTTYEVNLTPNFSGTAGFPSTGGAEPGALLAGDLPPAAAADGTLLAARYPVNIAYSVTRAANGVQTAVLSHGRLGVVATGAAQESLVIDLSPGGTSQLAFLAEGDDAAQTASIKLTMVARISDAKGTLNGNLLIDQLSADVNGNVTAGHVKFTGDISVAPMVGGVAGAPVKFLDGTLEVNKANATVASFSGSLTLPDRPAATLTMSVTEPSPDSGTLTWEGRYVQSGTTVTITGSKSAAGTSTTFAEASGVSTTVTSSSSTANVTVGGRQTAVIDKATNRITYSDGTFESLT